MVTIDSDLNGCKILSPFFLDAVELGISNEGDELHPVPAIEVSQHLKVVPNREPKLWDQSKKPRYALGDDFSGPAKPPES